MIKGCCVLVSCDSHSHGLLTSTDEEGVGHEGLEVVDLLRSLLSIKLAELKFNSLRKKNRESKGRFSCIDGFKRQGQSLLEGNHVTKRQQYSQPPAC